MFETEQDHEDKQKKPGDGIKDKDVGCDPNDDSRNPPSFPSKKRISDVTAVKLANGKEVECGYKQADPSGVCNRVQDEFIIAGDILHREVLDKGE